MDARWNRIRRLREKQSFPKAVGAKARSGPVASVWPGGKGVNVQVPNTAAARAVGGGEGGGGLVSVAVASSDGGASEESKEVLEGPGIKRNSMKQ